MRRGPAQLLRVLLLPILPRRTRARSLRSSSAATVLRYISTASLMSFENPFSPRLAARASSLPRASSSSSMVVGIGDPPPEEYMHVHADASLGLGRARPGDRVDGVELVGDHGNHGLRGSGGKRRAGETAVPWGVGGGPRALRTRFHGGSLMYRRSGPYHDTFSIKLLELLLDPLVRGIPQAEMEGERIHHLLVAKGPWVVGPCLQPDIRLFAAGSLAEQAVLEIGRDS